MSAPSARYRFVARTRRRCQRLRGEVLALRVRVAGGRCGRGLLVEAGVSFKHPLHPGLTFGSGVVLGRHTRIDVPWGGRLVLGDGVKLTGSTVVAASGAVELGPGTQVGEQCSIRDADHDVRAGLDMAAAALRVAPVRIGAGVWIGRGVAVLRGVEIGDGAVVGANSVVTRSLPARCIAVGAPARVVRER